MGARLPDRGVLLPEDRAGALDTVPPLRLVVREGAREVLPDEREGALDTVPPLRLVVREGAREVLPDEREVGRETVPLLRVLLVVVRLRVGVMRPELPVLERAETLGVERVDEPVRADDALLLARTPRRPVSLASLSSVLDATPPSVTPARLTPRRKPLKPPLPEEPRPIVGPRGP